MNLSSIIFPIYFHFTNWVYFCIIIELICVICHNHEEYFTVFYRSWKSWRIPERETLFQGSKCNLQRIFLRFAGRNIWKYTYKKLKKQKGESHSWESRWWSHQLYLNMIGHDWHDFIVIIIVNGNIFIIITYFKTYTGNVQIVCFNVNDDTLL